MDDLQRTNLSSSCRYQQHHLRLIRYASRFPSSPPPPSPPPSSRVRIALSPVQSCFYSPSVPSHSPPPFLSPYCWYFYCRISSYSTLPDCCLPLRAFFVTLVLLCFLSLFGLKNNTFPLTLRLCQGLIKYTLPLTASRSNDYTFSFYSQRSSRSASSISSYRLLGIGKAYQQYPTVASLPRKDALLQTQSGRSRPHHPQWNPCL